jgi:hypothetical protein
MQVKKGPIGQLRIEGNFFKKKLTAQFYNLRILSISSYPLWEEYIDCRIVRLLVLTSFNIS